MNKLLAVLTVGGSLLISSHAVQAQGCGNPDDMFCDYEEQIKIKAEKAQCPSKQAKGAEKAQCPSKSANTVAKKAQCPSKQKGAEAVKKAQCPSKGASKAQACPTKKKAKACCPSQKAK